MSRKLVINRFGCDYSCEYCSGIDCSYEIKILQDGNEVFETFWANQDFDGYLDIKKQFEEYCVSNNINYESGDSIWDWTLT